MQAMSRLKIFILVGILSLLLFGACKSNRMRAVPLYVPKGPVNELIFNEARIAGNIAFGLYQKGQYRQALSGYQVTLSNLFLIDHEQEIANTRHNLAQVYLALGEYDQAQREAETALAANRRFGFATRVALDLATLAMLNERRGRPGRALALYREAIVTLADNNGLARDLAIQYNNCGYLLLNQKKHLEAIAEFKLALRYALADEAHAEIAAAYRGIGRAQLALNAPEAALSSFVSALNADKAIEDSPAIAQSLKDIARAWEALGQLQNALEFYERALRINTSLQRFDRIKKDIGDLIRVQTALGNTKAIVELRQVLYDLERSKAIQ